MYAEIPSNFKPLFKRLVSDGMTPNVEDKLLFMKDNLIKISKHRAMKIIGDQENHPNNSIGDLDLSYLRISKKCIALDDDKKVSIASEVTPDEDFGGRNTPGSGNIEVENQQIEDENRPQNLRQAELAGKYF